MRHVVDIRSTMVTLWFMLVLSLSTTSADYDFSAESQSPAYFVALQDDVCTGDNVPTVSAECKSGHIADKVVIPVLLCYDCPGDLGYSDFLPPDVQQVNIFTQSGLSNRPRAPPVFYS